MFVRKLVTFISTAALTTVLGVGLASADGKDIFTKNGCTKCHSVKSAGVMKEGGEEAKGNKELSTVGSREGVTEDALSGFLKKTSELHGKKHAKEFKGSDADLKALVGWLASLK